MRRLPLRLRLTLAFGLVMAVVLAATGFVVYGIFRSDLNHMIDLALREGRTESELRAALESAGEETDRLARLAEDLLVLARADEHGLELRTEELDAGELLRTVAARFGVEAEDPGELRVPGDRARLEQALGDLADNALRHGRGMVRLRAVARGRDVELHVTDEGDGIDPKVLPHAFGGE